MTYDELSAKYVKFIVTGKLFRGGRFRRICRDAVVALNINLYNGRVWGVLPNGKRKLIKTVVN